MSDDSQPESPNEPENPTQPEHPNGSGALPEGWVAVPPPNPYAATAQQRPGRGLAIAAMAVGLVALLTGAVSAFYGAAFGIAAAALGVLALALGIGALAARQRPLPAGLTGVIGGALAILLAVSLGGLLGGRGFEDAPAPPNAAENGGTPEDAPEGDAAAIEWPANMSSGGVLFAGSLDPVRSPALSAGTAPAPREIDRENGPADIQLYVDYRCPHCVDFEAANAELLEEVVTSGAASLELRPMSFVSPFSASLTGALACVVDRQPERAWQAHLALLSRGTQGIASTADLAVALDSATDGLTPGTRSCVESGEFSTFAQALSSWFSANPVPNAVDPTLRVTGTPLAVVNGEPYAGDPADGAAFRAFLVAQGVLAG